MNLTQLVNLLFNLEVNHLMTFLKLEVSLKV